MTKSREEYLAYHREYNSRRREKARAYTKLWNEQHPEYRPAKNLAYRLEHRDKLLAYWHEYNKTKRQRPSRLPRPPKPPKIAKPAKRYPAAKIEIICEVCGTKRLRNKHGVRKSLHHFCSPKCQGQWFSQYMRGERHPRFRGPFVYAYGTKQWRQLRQEIIQRDKYKCHQCGSSQFLVVHHKQEARSALLPSFFDLPKYLITLCRSCHISLHAKRKTQR